MKRFMWLFLIFASLHIESALATPCAAACDKQWSACLKACPPNEGENGQACKNTCAILHEECLSACNRQPEEPLSRTRATKPLTSPGAQKPSLQ